MHFNRPLVAVQQGNGKFAAGKGNEIVQLAIVQHVLGVEPAAVAPVDDVVGENADVKALVVINFCRVFRRGISVRPRSVHMQFAFYEAFRIASGDTKRGNPDHSAQN